MCGWDSTLFGDVNVDVLFFVIIITTTSNLVYISIHFGIDDSVTTSKKREHIERSRTVVNEDKKEKIRLMLFWTDFNCHAFVNAYVNKRQSHTHLNLIKIKAEQKNQTNKHKKRYQKYENENSDFMLVYDLTPS